ncbi:hypothetical protein ISS30_10495 [bacterium]|nr:hypothetical protein [FCB group bacterium]MBL7192112.1 hypothetical protein [bacterium]
MKDKRFDCVQMKWDIQKRLLREMKGLSPDEEDDFTRKKILSNPVLSKIWLRADKSSQRNVICDK